MRFRLAIASLFACAQAFGQAFVHPGLLHTRAALDRAGAKAAAKAEPWLSGWKRLEGNSHASAAYQPHPVDTVYRGTGTPENYSALYNDIAAAYANALAWSITGEEAHAEAAMRILDAWSGRLKAISGTSDKYLAAGIYGYEFANAAELMRTHPGWTGLARSRDLLRNVFYPMNHEFLSKHNGSCISHYWANWDLVNMASAQAIGIFADDRALYDEAVAYFKTGAGNGSIRNVVWYLHPGGLGQWQEAGRDQGHCLLGPAILGAICETAWNQGDDLYGYDDNRVLKGFEYVAKYNLGDSVPYVPYDNCDHVDQRVISPDSRGGLRPGWEMIFNHYVRRQGLAAPYCQRYAEKVRPEGGGGDYGPNSGGYDQLGYGTLTATLPEGAIAILPAPRGSGNAKGGRGSRGSLDGTLPMLDPLGRLWPPLSAREPHGPPAPSFPLPRSP
jgi:Alginate lyase